DVDPPPLTRRGAGARRGDRLLREAEELATASPARRLATEVHRRGRLTVQEARLLGLGPEHATPPDVERVGAPLVSRAVWDGWVGLLLAAVDDRAAQDPLDPFLPLAAARDRVGAPDLEVVEALAARAGLEVERGRVLRPGTRPSLGPAQAGLDTVL